MKLTVIGFWGAYPGPGGASSGYLLEEGKESLLLDCGSGIISKLYNYTDLKQLNNVVLSHYHADHIADLGCLKYASKVQMSLGERRTPLSIHGHGFSDLFETLSYEDCAVGKLIEEDKTLTIGPFTLNFRRTPHPAPSFAMRIESAGGTLGYTGDTGWDPLQADFFKDIDLLLCESSLYNKFKGRVEGHLTAGEAGRLASMSGAGKLILTHLPHFGTHSDLLSEAAETFDRETHLAEEGLKWISGDGFSR